MIFILLYQIFSGGFLAWFNYWILKEFGDIGEDMHKINGGLHIIAACLIGFFCHWQLGVACLLFTRVVFDTALNIWRDLGLGYVSPNPDSWVDQKEKAIILWIAAKVHKKRTLIPDQDIQWIAIAFRIIILITAVLLLFI